MKTILRIIVLMTIIFTFLTFINFFNTELYYFYGNFALVGAFLLVPYAVRSIENGTED